MKFTPTVIKDVILIEPDVHHDERGSFLERWNERDFGVAGIHAHFVQDNHSHSKKGVLRGLHYQKINPQGKLVSVLSGEVFDVIVDLRKDSPTLGKIVTVKLTAASHRSVWIPPGLAHGFCALTDSVDLLYKTTDYYDPINERTIRWNDTDLAIDWPIRKPILSVKDATAPSLRDAEI